MAKLLLFGIIYINRTLNANRGICRRFPDVDVLTRVISDI